MREERISLEHIADAALLRRHVDAAIGVEQDAAVQGDAPGVGADEPGQALEREALARAGRPEQHADALARAPFDVERETGQALAQADLEALAHAARAARRPETTSTAQDSAVSTPTRSTASPASPTWTAV